MLPFFINNKNKMNITLTVGKPIPSSIIPKSYKLVVEYMHGDADGYTNKSYEYREDKIDSLKEDLIGLDVDDVEGYDDMIEQLTEAYQKYGIIDAEDRASTFYDRFVEYDIQYEGNHASVCGITLTYFDENSIEHYVNWDVTK